jgi:hypothetical protein
MVDIQPLQQNFPIVDKDGFYTVVFKRYLDNILKRMLGIKGGIYNTLDGSSGAALWDFDASPNVVITLTAAVTTITSLNKVAGAPPYRMTIVQDSIGGRLIAWGTEFKFPSAIPPVLSVGANAVDNIAFDSDGTNIRFQYGNKDIR